MSDGEKRLKDLFDRRPEVLLAMSDEDLALIVLNVLLKDLLKDLGYSQKAQRLAVIEKLGGHIPVRDPKNAQFDYAVSLACQGRIEESGKVFRYLLQSNISFSVAVDEISTRRRFNSKIRQNARKGRLQVRILELKRAFPKIKRSDLIARLLDEDWVLSVDGNSIIFIDNSGQETEGNLRAQIGRANKTIRKELSSKSP